MTTDEFMQDIWRGPKEQATDCRKCLEALGDGPEGDRLRGLLARIVLAFRRHSEDAWPAWPRIVDQDGQTVTVREIGLAVNWPEDQIDADVNKLVDAGLLRLEYLPKVRHGDDNAKG